MSQRKSLIALTVGTPEILTQQEIIKKVKTLSCQKVLPFYKQVLTFDAFKGGQILSYT